MLLSCAGPKRREGHVSVFLGISVRLRSFLSCLEQSPLLMLLLLCRTALARFHQAQLQEGKLQERTPVLASECNELPKAEKWRRREVSKKVTQIQNAGLGEFKIRDLNDEINNLLREKGDWEVRTIG
uniref:Pre-mRNA-splicing factor ISY1 homolog n=1 Tax=Sinocyclocheilus grahami TaxID=75366 RepID=A0A672LAF3_SINGR